MGEADEKQIYIQLIADLLNKVENVDLIKYFFYFINGKIKAGQ